MQNPNFKAAYITRRSIGANVLFHGPCEPEWMMDPAIIDSVCGTKSYNLALNHSNFADNYLHLYLYLKHQKKPEYIFLYVTPSSFDEHLANTFHTYKFSPFLDDSLIFNVVKENDKTYSRYSYIPLMRYAYYSDFVYVKALQGGYYLISDRQEPQHPNGYAPAIFSWNKALEIYQPTHKNFSKVQWSALREKYFRKTLELAKSYGCNIYVYESPMFGADLPLIVNRKEMLQKIKKITDEYSVPYLNFDTLAMSKDKENFWSTYNTTYKGSSLFSKIFAEYLRDSILKKHISHHGN